MGPHKSRFSAGHPGNIYRIDKTRLLQKQVADLKFVIGDILPISRKELFVFEKRKDRLGQVPTMDTFGEPTGGAHPPTEPGSAWGS